MTAAHWAVILNHTGETWGASAGTGLVKNQVLCLMQYLSGPEVSTWVSGAATVGRNRWRQVPETLSRLHCARIYLFPVQGGQAAILVGADALEKDGTAWWRIIALGIAALEAEKACSKQIEQVGSLSDRLFTPTESNKDV